MEHEIKLNIGAGRVPVDGYIPVDCKSGGEAYPLHVPNGPWPDGHVPDESVSEIRASHVLEHFSHRITFDVLREWVRVLMPGGKLRIAVPDLDRCMAARQAGKPWPIEQYLMGGHTDDDDFHGALFDEWSTRRMMRAAGLRYIRNWTSDANDCASLPISLNLEGLKAPKPDCRGTVAAMSVPRLGFIDNFRCANTVLPGLGIEIIWSSGVFWHKAMTASIEHAIESGAEYVLTLDYDSVFLPDHVEDLHRLMADSDADAICPVQVQRGRNAILACTANENGEFKTKVEPEDFQGELTRLYSGHFGLTLIRTSAIKNLARPWFQSEPDAEDRWGDKSTDADMVFWRRFREAGCKLYQANHVAIGHAQLVFTWPDENFHAVHQYPDQFHRSGPPHAARR